MKAIQIECSNYEWWGERWNSSKPYSFDFSAVPNHGLPNAPVSIYVMTPDPLEAAQLLRLVAAKLEREPALLEALQPGRECDGNITEVPF